MKLGAYAHISLSVKNLKDSMAFYEILGFKRLWGDGHPHPWHLMTDGLLNIHLYEFAFASPAIHYFSMNMDARVRELSRIGVKLVEERSKDGSRLQHSFYDPNEIPFMLMHHDDATMPKPDGALLSPLGMFGEFSIDTENLTKSCEFWKTLGFAERCSGATPYPWAILTDDVLTVGLHETSTFHAAALTYFSPAVGNAIRYVKEKNIEVTHEMTDAYGAPAGAIINSPDGQLIFLLKGHV